VSPTENIICAVDDSASGESVVMTAHWLAEGLGDRLIVVHSAPEHEPDREPLDGAVDAWLDGAEHEMRVLVGNAAPAILEEADDAGAALIVVGARGRGALRSALLGSVSRDVAARANCPVVVVPNGASAPRPDPGDGAAEDVIVCGVDGSDLSMTAASYTGRLARELGCHPVIVHARQDLRAVLAYPQASSATPPVTGQEDAVARLAESTVQRAVEAAGGEAREIIEPGPPTAVLNAVADRMHARLVVVAARGRGGVRATVLGSVAAELPATATRPVVVIPRGRGTQAGAPTR
jgi:nucleotide-binding universal stress UspA family protein